MSSEVEIISEMEFSQVKWEDFNGLFFLESSDNLLFFQDEHGAAIHVETGEHHDIEMDELVTPVKVKIHYFANPIEVKK